MDAPKRWADMSHAEQMAWGAAEHVQRMEDLKVRSAEGLRAAQANAEARRKAVGASRSQAANIVIEASRAARRAA